ncbi:Cleavage induced protein [Phytophthora megakarya]|uniref:Cleavage induced protein n=1 Tax=Phytophthora megakarya TaxID=4795 RepID=A0A225WXK2_9STRA|nr:Cleavage induced protein [Phytophthora megakarya]
MTGDVIGAFRNIPISAVHVGRFAGTIPELEIFAINLCCSFGWKNSPFNINHTGIGEIVVHFGYGPRHEVPWSRIKVPSGSPKFYRAVNVMNNTPLKRPPDREYFTAALHGISVGTQVSILTANVSNALSRILVISKRSTATRTQLLKLLRSLRHIATCIRPAAPFFQRVAAVARAVPQVTTEVAKDDLRWFTVILAIGRLKRIPLSSFVRRHEPVIHIHMDASDRLSDIERAIIDQGNAETNVEFCVNVRELMRVVFVTIVWVQLWSCSNRYSDTHVKFWIENTSAVAWSNKKSSRNKFAQMLLRILAIHEVRHGFYTSASHVAGSNNTMADAGNRTRGISHVFGSAIVRRGSGTYFTAELLKGMGSMGCVV